MNEGTPAGPRTGRVGGGRVAYFGGSFDPPHMGHIAVARAAREALGLDRVLFAPVGAQPLKPQGASAGFDDRVAMTRLAIESEPGFELSLADAPSTSGAPNFTFETLHGLRTRLPGSCTLYLLVGADAFLGLRQWHRAAEIPFVAPLIVASRPGQPLDNLRAALPAGLTMDPAPEAGRAGMGLEVYSLRNAAGAAAPFYLLPELDVEISASEIRAQLRAAEAEKAPQRGLLPAAVAAYIRAHGLYR